jgi:predicted lipoprotein with Yx(FWY)xxD motif
MHGVPRVVGVAAAALLIGACGGSTPKPSVTGSLNPTTTVVATTTTSVPQARAAGATITFSTTQFGNTLADGNGRTLYVFTADGPDVSNCTGSCLQLWTRYAPPAIVTGPGVDPARLGTIDVDGVKQLTINHRPLYYFAADEKPGDVRGQGIGGMWWVVKTDGTPITAL